MRALGFAALGFGAVIALGAALGAGYRSDASPLVAPTPTVTYSFAPDQVTATINDSSADGGSIQLFHYLGSGFVADGAPQPITASGDAFTFAVSTGTWALTTLDAGGGVVDNQHQFTVQGTPSISSLTWGSTVKLRGTGATFVPGSILAYRTDSYHPGPVTCADGTINTSTGAWTCDFPAPTDIASEYDTAVYQVAEQDYTGGITAMSPAVAYMNPAVVVDGWSFTKPNSVTAGGFDDTGMPIGGFDLSGDADTGSMTYQPANADGSTSGADQPMTDAINGGTCSSVAGTAAPIRCEADFSAARPSGLWAITTRQTDGSYPEVSDPATYVFIPPAPTMHVSVSDGATFFGSGLVGDSIQVTDGEGTAVCTAVVQSRSGASGSLGSWSCGAALFDSTQAYTATQTDAGDPTVDGVDPGVSIVAGGISLPAPLTAVPDLVVDQQLRSAGVTVTAQQGAESSGTSISFYHYASDGDTVNWYAYPLDVPLSCPPIESSPIQGANTCVLAGLEPGPYESYVVDTGPSPDFDSWWVVPETPSITSTVLHSNRTVTLRGTGVTGDAVRVIVDGANPACDGTVVADGSWTCTVAALSSGRSHSFQAYLQDIGVGYPAFGASNLGPQDGGAIYTTGGISAPSATTSLTISGVASAPTPTTTILPDWFFTITGVDLNHVHPGDTFTVSGTGLPPGSTVSGELHSQAVSIGSAVVQPDGSFSLPVTVPADFPAGAHTIVMTLTPPGSAAVPSQQPLKVVPAAAASEPTAPTPSDSPSPLGSAEGPGIDNHGPNSNILTHGLNSIADVVVHPAKVPAALEIGLVLLIFAVLPGHLLNATLAEQYERFTKRREQRRRGPGRWARLVAFLHRAPFVAGLALTTATALLFGFADPRFGFSLASLRLFLGLAIALAVVSYLTNAVVGRIMRGRWKVDVRVSLRPLGLILTVVGVVVSRLLDFSPGFLIGLVLGLVISEKHLAQQAWRAVLLRASILLGLALLAWVAFSLFDAKQEGGTFASELAIETLVAITTEAVVGLLVELLPLRLLEGEKLYEKSKLLWGGLYLLAVFIFVVAVVPWEGNWAELGSSLWTWIGIVVGFGIVATGIYLYFRIRGHEEHEAHTITDEDENERVPIASGDE
ncbi:MAG TPA: hypothetical protein VFQ74_06180 [Pseudolysinimonas sp.]|nr:hypothetical protein [Pseudolysinimonas sp.]